MNTVTLTNRNLCVKKWKIHLSRAGQTRKVGEKILQLLWRTVVQNTELVTPDKKDHVSGEQATMAPKSAGRPEVAGGRLLFVSERTQRHQHSGRTFFIRNPEFSQNPLPRNGVKIHESPHLKRRAPACRDREGVPNKQGSYKNTNKDLGSTKAPHRKRVG